jgi:drug/metabolite transporter (DMT)-like permease
VLGKYTFTFLSPFVLPTFRSIGVIPVFALYAYQSNPLFYVISPRQHLLMMVEALLGNTIAQQCFNYGTQLSSASLAGMCQPSIPVFTTLLAIALKREGVSRIKIVGIVIAITGSLVMVFGGGGGGGDDTTDSNYPLGAFFFIIQCACTSVYIIIQKPMFAEGVDVRTFTFYLFLYGGVGHVLIGSFFLPSVAWSDLPLTLIPILLYVILIATFAAFSLFVFATNNLPASVSSLGITLQSFFSPLLGAIFLGEVITVVDVMGGIAIVIGIVIVVWAKGKEGKEAKALTEEWMEKEGVDDGSDSDDPELTHDDDEDEVEPEMEEEVDVEQGHVMRDQRLTTDDDDGM